MTERDYQLLDVFTDRLFGGNQLAVFPNGEGLDQIRMQAIARELNLSETVFVFPSEGAEDVRLRIFTPGMELPFAGHPTIGTAIVLASEGGALAGKNEILLGELAGDVPVSITRQNGVMYATLTSPKLAERVSTGLPAGQAAQVLSIEPDDLATLGPSAYSAGVPFQFIPVASVAALEMVRLNQQAWEVYVAPTPAPHAVAFTMEDWTTGSEVHMRMFAPLMGIAEDPATGAAAAAIAGLLIDQQKPKDGTHRWMIHQGHAMGRPSLIELGANVRGGKPIAVTVGGSAVVVGRGTMRVE